MKKKNKKCVVEVYARTVGFFRPVQDWNKGKVEEFKDRVEYDTFKKKNKDLKGDKNGKNREDESNKE